MVPFPRSGHNVQIIEQLAKAKNYKLVRAKRSHLEFLPEVVLYKFSLQFEIPNSDIRLPFFIGITYTKITYMNWKAITEDVNENNV